MFLQQRTQPAFFLFAGPVANFGATHKFVIAIVAGERVAKNVSEPASHARTQIHSGRAQNYGDACRHVLATVLPCALDDGERAAIAHSKTFAHAPGDEKFSAGGAVEHRVAREHVAALGCSGSRGDGDSAAAQPFAHIIIRITHQPETNARHQKRAETLSSGAAEFAANALPRCQAVEIGAAQNVAAEVRADTAIGSGNGKGVVHEGEGPKPVDPRT